MHRKRLLVMGLAAAGMALGAASPAFAQTPDKKPNILFIMTDDVGWMDMGAYGGGADRGALTPNVDRLAKEGMRFTQYYAQPTCSLGRISVMTGRQPFRAGLLGVIVPGDTNGLHQDEVTLAEYLKKAGYHTMQTGKWHMGDQPKFYPTAHGFDEMHYMLPYYGNVYTYDDPNYYSDFPFDFKPWMDAWDKMNLWMWEQNPGDKEARQMPVCVDGPKFVPQGYAAPCDKMGPGRFKTQDLAYVDQWQADFVSNWIKDHAKDEKPFFIYLNFMRMHNPTNVPFDKKNSSPGTRPYTDGLQMLDADSGQVIQAVRDAGIADNTIIVWTTDNGAWIDTWPDSGNTPFRGEKSTAYEGGYRAPAIAWWPNKIPAGTVNTEMFSSMDWFPTFAKLAGLPVPPRHWKDHAGKPIVFDGVEQVDKLVGKGPGNRHEFAYVTAGQGFAGMRAGRWKAIFNAHDSWLGIDQNMTVPAIYDLLTDPYEQHDVLFTGAAPMSDNMKTSPGRSPLHDHGWVFGALNKMVIEFFAEMKEYPNRWEPPAGELLYQTIQPLPNGVETRAPISFGGPEAKTGIPTPTPTPLVPERK
jgi:arylsulfatase A-like enzyme